MTVTVLEGKPQPLTMCDKTGRAILSQRVRLGPFAEAGAPKAGGKTRRCCAKGKAAGLSGKRELEGIPRSPEIPHIQVQEISENRHLSLALEVWAARHRTAQFELRQA